MIVDANNAGDFMPGLLEKVSRITEKEIQKFIYSNEYETLPECEKYLVLEAYSNFVVDEDNAFELEDFIETVCMGEITL